MNTQSSKYKDHWKLLLAIFCTGSITISGQILILRDVMYLSQGNELTLGLIFCLYILLTALGSFFVAKIVGIKQNNKYNSIIVIILLIAAIALPLGIIGLTFARVLLVNTPTELIPITSLSWYILLVITPVCIAFGTLLPLFSKLLGNVTSWDNAFNITFLFESLGSGIGGVLIFLFVFPYIQPINIAFIISIFIMIIIFLIMSLFKMPKYFIQISIGISIVFLYLAISSFPHALLKKIQWQNLHYISGGNSKYGYVEVVRNDTQNNIYENGVLIASTDASDVNRDILKIALLQNPKIQNILLLGGGLNGLLIDIQSINVRKCDYLEPNQLVLKFIKTYFHKQDSLTNNISIYSLDDIEFIKQNHSTYDLIILAKPTPNTLINNRFYTVDYYQKLYKILNKQGLFFFSTASSSQYITEENAKYLASLYKSMRHVFPAVEVLPGDDCIFIASKSDDFKLNTGNTENTYKRGYFDLLFRKNIPIERTTLESIINNNLSQVETNRDLSPNGYIYNILQGTNYLITPFFSVIKYIHRVSFTNVLIITVILATLLFLIYLPQRKSFPYYPTAFIIGFTTMVMQLIIMLVFQITHGFLFFQLGILTALFMLGLAIGSGLIIFLKLRPFKYLSKMLIGNCIAMLLIIFLFLIISRTSTIPIFVFNSFSTLLGIVSGFFFLSVNFLQEYTVKHKANIATMYGFNLLGTSLGVLLTPLFLGIWGMSNVCFFIILLNIICLIITITYKHN